MVKYLICVSFRQLIINHITVSVAHRCQRLVSLNENYILFQLGNSLLIIRNRGSQCESFFHFWFSISSGYLLGSSDVDYKIQQLMTVGISNAYLIVNSQLRSSSLLYWSNIENVLTTLTYITTSRLSSCTAAYKIKLLPQ